jgi:HAD superfamily hydrolase (TIGR01509 family)
VLRAVILDLDGTLVDHHGAVMEAVSAMLSTVGRSATDVEALRKTWWELERRHMDEYLAGACTFAEQRRRRLRTYLPLLGQPVPPDLHDLDAWFVEHYLGAYEDAWRLYPDVGPCLRTLRDSAASPRLAVLTNGDGAQQRAKVARFQLRSDLDAVLVSEEIGVAKPDPVAFLRVCERLGVEPSQAVSVGDWLEGDAVAAHRAGLTGIWLDRGLDPRTGLPTAPGIADGLPITRIGGLGELSPMLSVLTNTQVGAQPP